MRKNNVKIQSEYKIIVVDDDNGILDSLSVIIKRLGYEYIGINNPLDAIESIRNEHYDLLVLDFLMDPIQGDAVVERIREFDTDLYILLLTGYKDVAPPLETIKSLEIQAYCEKMDNFDQLILLIESAIKSISQKRTIKKFRDGLKRILDSVPKIYQLQSIGSIIGDILLEIMPFVQSENAFILIDDLIGLYSNKKSFFKGVGKYDTSLEELLGTLDHKAMEAIGSAKILGRSVKLDKGVILPLISKSALLKTEGVIYLESEQYDDEIELLELYATQAATSINNVFLHSMVNIKNDELDRTYSELKKRYMDAVQVLRLAVDAKDEYTRGHSDRVAFYAVKIGEAFNLPTEDINKLNAGGIFHDIGKIGTADDILLKTDKLDDREYKEIKKHPTKGANILSAVSMFRDVVPLVMYHHERLDGRGYPEGIKGDDIPFLARIISVADAFDAMTSDRKYRSKLHLEEAKKQLASNAGTQFDSEVVEKFLIILEDFDLLQGEIESKAHEKQIIKNFE
ncbi:HD domain-containing phosphohydrolase [Acetivibrio cellulolyticus]|uniref:HD domain-containing phosphohydrolase n=1 Tax=Acetivibrio cellulolyticus TaxID=35830 RepID=UPI0001E2DEFD|nr:HD domain-containing phosphohydrolase [Acetivibrio cellulolyticus]